MKVTRINNKNLDLETFFGAREQYFLRASAPKHKLILNAIYSNKNLSISSSLTRYSNLELLDWQIYKPLSDFDNSPEKRISASIDKYVAKYTLDCHFSYKLSKNYSIQIGVNNLFNTYPTQQGENTDSGGLWDAVQMGSNGAFYYSKFSVNF